MARQHVAKGVRAEGGYLDWLESELKGDVKGFFKECEEHRTPEHGTCHEAYSNVVYRNFLKREKAKLPRPA